MSKKEMLEAALDYASTGIPVFPCKGKQPLIKGGFKGATTEEKQIREWWERWPDASIGLPTGETSGLWVVDVDCYKEGVQDLPELFAEHELPETQMVRTGNGGRHYYFKYNGKDIGCSIGTIAKGVDVKANGGYVIAPPSPGYEWENDFPAVPAPSWLEDKALEERKPAKQANETPIVTAVQDDLEVEIQRVRLAEDGVRNGTLNLSAYILGQKIAWGKVDEESARLQLNMVAKEVGLDDTEIPKTIDSGIQAGKLSIPGLIPIEPLGLEKFISLDLPERGMILKPIIPEQGIVEVYGPRGILKTWFVLGLGLAIASGEKVFWTWEAPEPRKVLFIDGEMSIFDLQTRINQLIRGYGYKPDDEHFQIINPDKIPLNQPVPNIASSQGQRALSMAVAKAEVVILDNLSCLASHGKENEAESWGPVQKWLLALRRQGKTAIFVHHANKSGGSSGTSARERICDTVINLKKPQDYQPIQGARAEVHFEKARGFYGADAVPFELSLSNRIDGSVKWIAKLTGLDKELSKILEMNAQGMSLRGIAKKLGIGHTTVKRRLDAVSELACSTEQ